MALKSFSVTSAFHALSRRKYIAPDSNSQLAKVLSTLDLTALGVGSTLGVGVYVLAGEISKRFAGPAVVISFLIAALASVLAGLCYAEFGARVPKAGSAYVYSYVCVGEFFAFVIGWNLILEYLIGSATVTKAIFTYLDELANNSMSVYFKSHMPMHAPEIAPYADIFSLALPIIFATAIAFGARESSIVNNIFTLVNLVVVSTVIISGIWKAKASYWNISKSDVPAGYGDGGFAPYGVRGIIKGAAKCFFGFIGFDCIATAGEEAKDPKKSIPIGIVLSLTIVFLAYFGSSTMLTMMLPYYEQDTNAPLPHVYEAVHWPALKYVVSVGAMCGLFASLLGSMFPLPRIIYAMAADGLIFRFLSQVHPKFHTPFLGTLIGGSITGVLACLFELDKLTDMMSIGTLLAYSMVAACVLILRYGFDEPTKKHEDREMWTPKKYALQLFNTKRKVPTPETASIVAWLIFFYFCLSFVFAGLITGFEDEFGRAETWLMVVLSVIAFFLILLMTFVSLQPKSSKKLTFSVPLVPWIPGISILVNVYLMTTLPGKTWKYYGCWMAIGLIIYFAYGLWHSDERKQNREVAKSQL